MSGDRVVMVVGNGSFATGICRELAREQAAPTTVYVVGRDTGRARAVCSALARQAWEHRTAVRFEPVAADLGTGADLRPLVRRLAPRVVLVCASEQSPREIGEPANRWSELVRRAGFALTLPLQLTVAEQVARACQGGDEIVLNACFPDAVNPILAALGRPVTSGVGNVGTLADAVCVALDITADRLVMLAHHVHLHAPRTPDLEARCWVDGQPVRHLGRVLAAARGRPRGELNDRGAEVAGKVVRSLLDTGGYTGHLPGPAGLPGGFPVVVSNTTAMVCLPRWVDPRQANQWTERVSAADGAVVGTDGTVRFTDDALDAIRVHRPQWPRTVPATELSELRADLLDLRQRLRGPPPG